MGRYRPPAPQGSKYITREGAERLRSELEYLWGTKRPAVTKLVAEAAAQGDRSENADYIYGKKQLAEIDRRVRYLRKRFDGMQVVDQAPQDPNRIYFGAWFKLSNEVGDTVTYRLIGPDEIDSAKHNLSIDSPLGKAVLGKMANDEFMVTTPQGDQRFRVASISYANPLDKKKPGT